MGLVFQDGGTVDQMPRGQAESVQIIGDQNTMTIRCQFFHTQYCYHGIAGKLA